MIPKFDVRAIALARRAYRPFARFAIFVVYFWFGILKVVGTSSANPLVRDLLEATLPFISFSTFIIAFGLFEMTIGVFFLIPRAERTAVALLIPHLMTTALPLVILRAVTWSSLLTPTLEGQYIVKNLLIIALALTLTADLQPLGRRSKQHD